MRWKWAIIVALLLAGCGQAFEASVGNADGGLDAQAGGDAGQADASTGTDGGSGDSGGGDAVADAAMDAVADAAMDAVGDALDATADAGGDANADAGAWSPVCPAAAPTAGSMCMVDGLQCEYPRLKYLFVPQYDVACDMLVLCSGGAWTDLSITSTECNPDSANSTDCPAIYGDIMNGGSCPAAEKELRCRYAAGVCVCAPPLGGPVTLLDAGANWGCDPGAGCPMPRPRLGSACTTVQVCTYETCAYEETCGTSGVWQGMQTGCAVAGASP